MNPEDKLFITLKYNAEIFSRTRTAFIKYDAGLFFFLKAKGYTNITVVDYQDPANPDIGVSLSRNEWYHEHEYNELLTDILEYEQRRQTVDNTEV